MFDFDLEKELSKKSGPKHTLGPDNNWQDSLRTSIKSKEELEDFFNVNIPNLNYEIKIPLKFAHKIKKSKALWDQFIPSRLEENDAIQSIGFNDPIGDELHFKHGQIVHRYPNRVLFLPTSTCAGVCRFCFRKNNIKKQSKIFDSNFFATLDYLKKNLEIEELIFSGGDPLILTDERLKYYLTQFHANTLIRYIRFHTRITTFLPERMTDVLFGILSEFSKKFIKLNIVIHINHPDELDRETVECINRMKKAGVEVLSQTVLLRNVNDTPETLKQLINKLMLAGVRPYYLHHPDKVKGGMHFYLSLEEGRKIYAKLRNIIPGWAIPQYILDIPEGQGKTPAYNPESFECSGKFITKDSKIIKINKQSIDISDSNSYINSKLKRQ